MVLEVTRRVPSQMERGPGHSRLVMFSLCLQIFFILRLVFENGKLRPTDKFRTGATSVRTKRSFSKF